MTSATLPETLQTVPFEDLSTLTRQAERLRALRRDGIRLAARRVPAGDAAGDFVVAYPLGQSRWLIGIGDAMGRGPEARRLAQAVKDYLEARANKVRRLGDLLAGANELVCELGGGESFVSLLLFVVDARRRTLRIANAGHVEPLAAGRSGGVVALEGHGPALGLIPGAEYRDAGPLRFPPRVLVLAATDGVTEATSPTGEHFGRERTASALARARARGPRGAVREVVESLLAFGDGEPRDAATVLALRFDR